MAQSRVEVIGDPRLESVEIDIDKERVTLSLNAGKRNRKQIGQRRPVEPISYSLTVCA